MAVRCSCVTSCMGDPTYTFNINCQQETANQADDRKMAA
jgi:hypothetical protein